MSEYLFDDNHLFSPIKENLSETEIKKLKSKGYIWDPHEEWWVRVWTTNSGKEKCLECFAQTKKNKWVKLMISENGQTFFKENVESLA
tara:strand:+ start:147 stop:410 length:264 start_codon:yes stop_codon:yes gene_type:complete